MALDEQLVLGETDLANHYTLVCSARPLFDGVILTHQEANIHGG